MGNNSTQSSKKKEMNFSSREQGFLIMALLLTSCVTSGTLLPPHLQLSPCQRRAGLTALGSFPTLKFCGAGIFEATVNMVRLHYLEALL